MKTYRHFICNLIDKKKNILKNVFLRRNERERDREKKKLDASRQRNGGAVEEEEGLVGGDATDKPLLPREGKGV